MSPVIWIRNETFDHGVFNTSVRWTYPKVLDFMNSVRIAHAPSSISRSAWVEVATTRAKPALTENEAIAYWHVFTVFPSDGAGDGGESIDICRVGIMLMCQVFSPHRGARTDHFTSKATEMWPVERAPSSVSSPRHSPRGSSPRVGVSGQTAAPRSRDSSSALMQFVRHHFVQFMQMACGSLQAEPVTVSMEEFDALSILLQAGSSLSSPLRLLSEGVPELCARKSMPIKELKKQFEKCLVWNEEVYPPGEGHPSSSTEVAVGKTLNISGMHKSTWFQKPSISGEVDFLNITSCNDCVIYITFPSRLCFVAGCHDCTIVMGPVSNLCTVQNCEKSSVHVASHCFKMENCIDSSAYLYTKIPPILTGDTRGIKLAPYNVLYSQMNSMLQASSLPLEASNVDVWAHPVCCTYGSPDETLGGRSGSFDESTSSSTYHFVHPKSFHPTIIPEANARFAINRQMLVLPQAYDDALKARIEDMRKYFVQLAEMGDEGKRKVVQQAIQGHFREWLQTTGKARQLGDLARIVSAGDR